MALPKVVRFALVLVALARSALGGTETRPLPDLLGDEPTDGTPAGWSAPAPAEIEANPEQREHVDHLKRDSDKKFDAAERLADLYMEGKLVERDLAAAAKHLRMAIKLGSATAQNKLGVLLANGGPGLARDPVEALERLREGAKLNDPKALYNLAQQYRSGELVERDEAEALRLFRRAADQKLPDAQVNAGIMMMEGIGGPANEAAGAAALQQAAAADNVRAWYFLGLAYAKGRGVRQDRVEARKWLQKAFDKQFRPAAAALNALDRP